MSLALSLPDIWGKVWPILVAILFFEVIIIIHEAGHLLAAKANGVKVDEFAIGMGPKLFSFKKGETRYSVRIFPIGGFCAMEGEDEASDSDRGFDKKKIWQRMIIIAAGAICNLILGFLLVVTMTANQNLVGTTQVAQFDEGATSAQSGLREMDEIKSIDGMRIYCSFDISTGLSRDDDGVVDMEVKRDGKLVELKNVKFQTEAVDMGGGKMRSMIKMDFFILGEEKTVGNVLRESAKEAVALGRAVFLSLHDLLVGKYSISDLSGPVGTVSVVAKSVSVSFTAMLRIMALISINIGLFNLFPIPALDGWRFFTLLIEGIFRRPLNKKVEYAINAAGLVLLLGFMAIITFSDITKLF